MKTFFLSMAGALAAMFIFILLMFGFLMMLIMGAASSAPERPDNVVLSLDLNAEMTDQAPTGGFAALSSSPGFIDLLTKLKAAESDEHVKGLFIRGAFIGTGSSRAEDLRQALHSFRDSGKFVIAHSQGTLGVRGPSAYWSIAAADEIWMQPGSDLVVPGLTFETEFFKGLFEKIDVTPEIYPFYEYKNAPNSYKETSYTEPHKEALLTLAESVWSTGIDAIAEDRGLKAADVRTALESGPLPAETAISMKLLDKTGYPEEASAAALERAGKDAELVELAYYDAPAPGLRAPQIAVVGGEGAVVTGGGESDSPFSSPPGFASDTIARAILDAGKNDKIKAIIFRVDSPGGSPVAADQIWNAIERVQADGKPVVVSMGSLAASGGYYVSAGADYIIANRATITGSIGIYGGKFAVEGGFNKLGITFDRVSVGGEFADAYGADTFTDTQAEAVKDMLKRGYDRFLGIVAEGRGMTYDEVHEIARGRILSGEDALEVGLVDEVGTFIDAIEKAKELAGIEADETPRLVYYPHRPTGLEALEALFGVSAEGAEAAITLNRLASDDRVQVLMEQLAAMEAVNSGQTQAIVPRFRER
ncbi:MAG: signal peptide peptidase SppA [Pseudomonadota bacterium]|nr:signal peptide peptidase SppA [Pseudomonadota bacterium]